MRALLALLFLLLSSGISHAQQIAFCDQVATFSIAAQPATQFIPAVPGKRIGICGMTGFTVNNPGTFQVLYGGGTNCATNQSSMSANVTLPSNSVYVNHLASIYQQTPPGMAICLASTGNGTISGSLYYTYF